MLTKISMSGASAAQMVRCLGCPMSEQGGDCHFENVTLEPREAVPQRFETGSGFALVRRGLVIRQREDARGRKVAVDIVGPGQGYRIGAGSGYAIERTLLCVRPATSEQMPQLVPEVGDALLQSMDRMERLMLARSRPTAEERVSALLESLPTFLGPRHGDHIPADLLQQDMAALLAMRHESVCRALRALRERGVLRRDAEGLEIIHTDDRAAS